MLYFGIAAGLLVLVMFLGWFIRKRYLGTDAEETEENQGETD